jgi:HK97 family phage portal protein
MEQTEIVTNGNMVPIENGNIVFSEKDYKKLIDGEIMKMISLSSSSGKRSPKGLDSDKRNTVYNNNDSLRRAADIHSWTRATVSVIARSAVGGGISITRHPVYGRFIASDITEEQIWNQLEPVYDFFYGVKEEYNYFQDMTTLSQKLYYTVLSFFLYGQAAWHLRRDENGNLYDFDILAGVVFPNVKPDGRFMNPAYTFRPWNSRESYDIKNPNDVLYISWPGIDFSIYGSSEYKASSETAIPADLYASNAYKSHFENMNAPYNGVWTVDPNTSEEEFYAFLKLLNSRYSGAENWGRNPLVIKGQAEFKETRSRTNDDAPYLQGRTFNQEEISAVAGVPGAKLGLAGQTTKSNYREQRREFHETTLRPIFEMLEQAIYQQIFVRGFGIKSWMLSFNNPDFTNALEDASINTRYVNYSVMTPNEARARLGLPLRQDAGGDSFFVPSNMVNSFQSDVVTGEENSTRDDGSNSEPRDSTHDAVDMPSNEKPTVAEDEKFLDDMLDELRKWKKFKIRTVDNKRVARDFVTEVIPKEIAEQIRNAVIDKDREEIRFIFDKFIEEINNLISEGENG